MASIETQFAVATRSRITIPTASAYPPVSARRAKAAAELIVQGDALSKHYLMGQSTVTALRGVSVRVGKGEFVALAGPSGSGKSTLLNLLGCIEQPSSGRVYFSERDTSVLTPKALSELRLRNIGFVFQNFNLLPVFTALENVELPLALQGLAASARRTRAYQALERMGLEAFAQHRPAELSGGQQQRVAIARAIATQPILVLADEPTANLDQKTGREIIAMMDDIRRTSGTTIIISTHDPRVIATAERVIRLSDGKLVEEQR